MKAKKEKHVEDVKDNEELWKRLDELEVQEELDAYLETQQKRKEEQNDVEDEDEISEAGSEDWSQSPDLTDDEYQQASDAEEQQKMTKINDYKSLKPDGGAKKMKAAVPFKDQLVCSEKESSLI